MSSRVTRGEFYGGTFRLLTISALRSPRCYISRPWPPPMHQVQPPKPHQKPYERRIRDHRGGGHPPLHNRRISRKHKELFRGILTTGPPGVAGHMPHPQALDNDRISAAGSRRPSHSLTGFQPRLQKLHQQNQGGLTASLFLTMENLIRFL